MAIGDDPGTLRTNGLKVAVTLCMTYTLCLFFVGLWMRIRSRTYARDDVSALVATVLAMGQFASQYVALANDLGRSSAFLSSTPHIQTLNKASHAGVILFFIALYCSKGSIIALTARFASPGRHILTNYVLLGFTALLGVATLLELNVNCGQNETFFWHIEINPQRCPGEYVRWQISTAFDIVTEVLILLLPIDFIWSLQMRTKAKFEVLSRFWIRAPVIALAAARQYYIHQALSSTNAGRNAVFIVVFQEAEMAYSLSVATLITLRPFARDFNTGFGLGGDAVTQFGASKAYGAASSGSAAGGNFMGSHRGQSHVTSGHSMKIHKSGSKSRMTEHKDSEEYILQEQPRPDDSRIYKHTTYTIQTEVNSGSDIEDGREIRGLGTAL